MSCFVGVSLHMPDIPSPQGSQGPFNIMNNIPIWEPTWLRILYTKSSAKNEARTILFSRYNTA